MQEQFLKNEEKAVFALRSLYRSYGYLPYKMSKFEEYDLYLRNKDFLVSDRIITFNDTNGRLMALKPDVTLSIIKNSEDTPGVKRKVCYNENVYRVSGGTHRFKEILQAGLECIGDIDAYDIYEAVSLASESLSLISRQSVLDVSHLGILSALLEEMGADEALQRELTGCVADRNLHDMQRICREHGISEEDGNRLCELTSIYGAPASVLARLEPLCRSAGSRAALEELRTLASLLQAGGQSDRIRFDLSIVNDMNYYNGIVFRGFLDGICENVLLGGQYDKLMHRMGRRAGAIGFAIYLDLLEDLARSGESYDVDVLVLYDKDNDPAELSASIRALTAAGKCVSAQKAIPQKLRAREILDLRKGGAV